MTYFADGSTYSFGETNEAGPLINIGWLSAGHSYPTGAVPEQIVVKLARLCRMGVHRTRGLHRCEFCVAPEGSSRKPATSSRDEEGEFVVGGAEIRVASPSGVTFAAPDMIIHYVTAHGYRPPAELPPVRRTPDLRSPVIIRKNVPHARTTPSGVPSARGRAGASGRQTLDPARERSGNQSLMSAELDDPGRRRCR